MELLVYDKEFQAVGIIDTYTSLIWTDRYDECGDFEIQMSMTSELLKYIKQDYYLYNKDSEHVMIIEKILIESDIEEGNTITITGRSLESILDRRVVWGQKTLSGSLQDGIQSLLDENVISPSKETRKIDNFVFEASTDSAITEMKIDAQYTGDNLYDVICGICSDKGIGFKVTLNDANQFVFKLYSGVDRSYAQESNPYVVFSPAFDNLISSNYIESKSALKNVTLIGGEGEGSSRRYTAYGNVSGLERREMFTDARDISSDVGNGKKLKNDEYISQLRQRGSEDLAENVDILSFEGQAETSQMFVYGTDFFKGDIVQIENEYGQSARVRILEFVFSSDESGTTTYPTFSVIEDDENTQDPNTILLLHAEDFYDSSMYNNEVVNDGVTLSTEVVKFGKSFAFGSSVKSFTADLSMDLSAHDFTIDWWEYRNSDDSENSAVCIFGESKSYSLLLGLHSSKNILLCASGNGENWDLVNAKVMGVFTPNQWIHRAIVRQDNNLYIFENGTLLSTITSFGDINIPDSIVTFSHCWSTGYLSGYIDEFRVSSIARWTKDFTPRSSPYTS